MMTILTLTLLSETMKSTIFFFLSIFLISQVFKLLLYILRQNQELFIDITTTYFLPPPEEFPGQFDHFFDNDDTDTNIDVVIDITATYFLPPIASGEVETAPCAATFARSLRLSVNPLTDGAARLAVIAALADVHVRDEIAAAYILRRIIRQCDELMRDTTRGAGFRVETPINITVDVLPPVNEFYTNALFSGEYDSDVYYHNESYVGESPPAGYTNLEYFTDDDDSDIDADDNDDNAPGNDEVRFVLSKEFLEGLEKRKEKMEEAETCGVCLNEAPVGSELTKLPCSHWYHVECIVSWLERRKVCPYCRFQLP